MLSMLEQCGAEGLEAGEEVVREIIWLTLDPVLQNVQYPQLLHRTRLREVVIVSNSYHKQPHIQMRWKRGRISGDSP
jgi:hypothetical protein